MTNEKQLTETELKENVCLKFTGYIFLPKDNADFNNMRYHAGRTPGRIRIFNAFNKKTGAMKAFTSISQMGAMIAKENQKRIYKIVKNKKSE